MQVALDRLSDYYNSSYCILFLDYIGDALIWSDFFLIISLSVTHMFSNHVVKIKNTIN